MDNTENTLHLYRVTFCNPNKIRKYTYACSEYNAYLILIGQDKSLLQCPYTTKKVF